MLDYLVVGLGLAGVSFCEQLEKQSKTFRVINDNSQRASKVAGGLYNPVILKRFNLAWKAHEQLEMAIPFYESLEKKLQVKLHYKLPILRKFASVEEQNLWFEASDKKKLKPFLSQKIQQNTNPYIDAFLGYGEVLHTGRIDTQELLLKYNKHLHSENKLLQQTFNYQDLVIHDEYLSYKSIMAKQIVFAEGFGLHTNPYFNYLPLTSTKGEYIDIEAPNLRESCAIKSSIFLIPWKDDLYRVGATYKWQDTTNLPTEDSKAELIQKLNTIIKCKYEVVGHEAGIRPTVSDRKPLVGQHPKYKNVYVLNGFGSRGVLIAPYASNQLFNFIEINKPIHSEMDIKRFVKKYIKK